MEQWKISLAGLNIEIQSRFPTLRAFFRDYLTEADTVDFSAAADAAEPMALPSATDAQSAELLRLHRAIAERLPGFQRFLVHGAAISWNGKGILFLAPSGTGKSTHIRLWRSVLGDGVGIVNGDKPIIDASGEVPMVCGSPWAGKEHWQKNVSVPLGAVCILRRGDTDAIRRAVPGEEIGALLCQVYRSDSTAALTETLKLAERVFCAVPLYELRCTPTPGAVIIGFPALTGEPYPGGNRE